MIPSPIFLPKAKLFKAALGIFCYLGISLNSWSQGSETIILEAEDGVLTSPMTKAMDPQACGGAYIYTPTTAYEYTSAHEAGSAQYTFTVAGGDYVIWARAAATTPNPGGHNSFYVSVDGGAEDVWDVFEDTGGDPLSFWTYDQISLRCGGDSEVHNCNPFSVSLQAGTHTLTFTGRECLSLLDKIVLTSDLAYIPQPEISLTASITIGWTPPDTNEDGSTLNNLGGYKIYYGLNSGNYDTTIDVGPTSTVTISSLEPNQVYYLATTAYNLDGNESIYSEELVLATDDDVDLDGMADSWENYYFGGIGLPSGEAMQDPDGDGVSNRGEYLAGTDPNIESSRQDLDIQFDGLNIQASTVISPALGFAYFGKERYFRLEKCTDLFLDLWEPVPGWESVLATGQLAMMAAGPETSSCSFRTVIWLQ